MKLSPPQVVILVVLLALFSFFVQFAIAKWRYEKKRKRPAEEQRKAEKTTGPPA